MYFINKTDAEVYAAGLNANLDTSIKKWIVTGFYNNVTGTVNYKLVLQYQQGGQVTATRKKSILAAVIILVLSYKFF